MSTSADGSVKEVPLLCRIDKLDELEYFKNGGILQTVLRGILSDTLRRVAALFAADGAVLLVRDPDAAAMPDLSPRELWLLAPIAAVVLWMDRQHAELELVLVKNPAGFTVALSTYGGRPVASMVAINDNYADGRDVSWLYDVNFASLRERGVELTSGVRAYDMALRLAGWFSGRNDARRAMYDPATGRVMDGIGGPDRVNANSGAESTIEGLLALRTLDGAPLP